MENQEHKFLPRYFVGFIGIGSLLFPFTYFYWPIAEALKRLWCPIIQFAATSIFHFAPSSNLDSDSPNLLLFLFFITLISFPYSLLLRNKNVYQFHKLIARTFTVFILLRYGFDKITKSQFYLPEPNILYTPFGKLDKDIAFWSLIGSSYSLNLILGCIEFGIALCLLFKKTRSLGWFSALINFSIILVLTIVFDIHVKLLVSFILLIALVESFPILKKLFCVFIQNKPTTPSSIESLVLPKRIKLFLSFIGLIILGIEVYTPMRHYKSFNDDKITRPYLHGAYQIINNATYKKLFIHRDNFLILQDTNDRFYDYPFSIDKQNKTLQFFPNSPKQSLGKFNYNPDSSLTFYVDVEKEYLIFKVKQIEYRDLPLLK
jgi:hypothetical protein